VLIRTATKIEDENGYDENDENDDGEDGENDDVEA